MTECRWIAQVARRLMWLVPGAMVLGASCGVSDIRNSLVAAGLDFVEESAFEVLTTLVPVGEILGGQ